MEQHLDIHCDKFDAAEVKQSKITEALVKRCLDFLQFGTIQHNSAAVPVTFLFVYAVAVFLLPAVLIVWCFN